MEMTASLDISRGHGAAEAGEGSAKEIKTVKEAAGYEAPPAAAAQKKKTQTVMAAVSKEHVDIVLAAKPTVRSRPVLQPMEMSEETGANLPGSTRLSGPTTRSYASSRRITANSSPPRDAATSRSRSPTTNLKPKPNQSRGLPLCHPSRIVQSK
ncbi:hypothetical protein PVAP13_6NG324900 [Panicum virgatum]|uniref:Uncharacterized protein n=1 Tax=Panicum virgatum TaxID=38727 RepID=A0A8T0R4Q0_PANVG|nr:hypothetical protein PVAP13_6NG324900 [Panicum virgatum]